jgi:hypothetical protein
MYWHMNQAYPVGRVPFAAMRPQIGRPGASLTILRLIIVAVETGLRFQGVQRLCKRQFDEPNAGKPIRDVAQLHVNTDKTGGPFNTVILSRVRDLLLREKADRLRLLARRLVGAHLLSDFVRWRMSKKTGA